MSNEKRKQEYENIVSFLTQKVNEKLTYDSVPENDNGWYELKREDAKKIIDSLIPQIKKYLKS